jgi:hypothetical protein
VTTVLQRTEGELKSAIETMFRIRAVESPPDEEGARTIWHRGAKGADLVTYVDAAGRVSRQELFLFNDYFLWERALGVRTGMSVDRDGSAAGAASDSVAFDQDQLLRTRRLSNAAGALATYAGGDKLIGHLKEIIIVAARGSDYEGEGTVTRSAHSVRLDEVKAASQELEKRELEARLNGQRRNLWLFIAGALVAAAGVVTWLVTR